jgi:hypothetical protein
MDEEQNTSSNSRRQFLKKGLMAGAGMVAGGSLVAAYVDKSVPESGEKIKVLTTSGEIMEVDQAHIKLPRVSTAESHLGIPGLSLSWSSTLGNVKTPENVSKRARKDTTFPKVRSS